MFKVVNPGPHTLVQDGGRQGVLHLGVTSAGPMDRLSFDWANRLCGNQAGTAALEITFGGLELEALQATMVVVTGPPCPLFVNDSPATPWQGLALTPGDRLRIGQPRLGCRLYLALAGGFVGQRVFGSRATVPREGLGGIDGRPLVSGDRLALARAPEQAPRPFALPDALRPTYPDIARETPLRVIPCLQARDLPRAARRLFFTQTYRLTPHSDRMGCRFEGQPLEVPSVNLLSEGITPGAIQLPPDGQPIVLMRDHQTLGGYPRIGAVIGCDLDTLGQLVPGAVARFSPITLNGARALLRQARRRFEATCPVALDGPL